MTTRWPVHPAPQPGEALYSWLNRVADRYDLTVETLSFDLGYVLDRHIDLDMAAPEGFAEQVARRTGVSVEQVRKMSISGFVPWLLDHIDPGPEAFTPYTRQLSILLPEGKRTDRTVASWRAWVPTKADPPQRACPQCVAASTYPHPYQLMWSIPLMLTCPAHHCRLEPHQGARWYYYSWLQNPPTPQEANTAIQTMDGRTWQALTTGNVDLPRRRVHAGIWFRLLRTLLDELNATLKESGQKLTRRVWDQAGHPFRTGQTAWKPYEKLPIEVQLHTLEAAAIAMRLLEDGRLIGQGRQAGLFLPEPDVSIDPGRPHPMAEEPSAAYHWLKFNEAAREAVEDAKQYPDSARQLFNLMTLYRSDDADHIQSIRANFEELGIPLDYLSH